MQTFFLGKAGSTTFPFFRLIVTKKCACNVSLQQNDHQIEHLLSSLITSFLCEQMAELHAGAQHELISEVPPQHRHSEWVFELSNSSERTKKSCNLPRVAGIIRR